MYLRFILYLGLPIIITIIGYFTGKYYALVKLVDKQESIIEELRVTKINLEYDLNTEKNNVIILEKTVEDLNNDIIKLTIKNNNTIKAFNDFKNKTNDEKYNKPTLDIINNDKLFNGTCEDGLKLNQMISNLNYDDL